MTVAAADVENTLQACAEYDPQGEQHATFLGKHPHVEPKATSANWKLLRAREAIAIAEGQ